MENKKNGSEFWIHVWNGLVNDKKHRKNMGDAIWTYLNILDWCDKESGVIMFTTYDMMNKKCGIAHRTLQRHVSILEKNKYISVEKLRYGMKINVNNYRTIRHAKCGDSENPDTPNVATLDAKCGDSDTPNVATLHLFKKQNKITKQKTITRAREIQALENLLKSGKDEYGQRLNASTARSLRNKVAGLKALMELEEEKNNDK